MVQGQRTVGDAVLFITMMNNLCVPLTYFGSYYRQVSVCRGRGGALSASYLPPLPVTSPPPALPPLPLGLMRHRPVHTHTRPALPCPAGVPAPLSPCRYPAQSSSPPTLPRPSCPAAPPQVQKALIDMENMFDLLRTEPKVRDCPGAIPLVTQQGQVAFDNVVFGYNPANPVLKGVSFTVPGG